ncbi:MAG: helix-turn-helix transcriptional regulator, partial [Acidobacteriota bacterium]
EEGALYPALHRLEKKGLLESEWGMSEKKRQAKFYRLSETGKAHLQAETSRWNEHASAVRLVLDARRK